MSETTHFVEARKRDWRLSAGLALTGSFVVCALLSLVWTPYDVTALDIAAKLGGFSRAHWLGTDALGRDVVSLLMAGARNSLAVAVSSAVLGLVVGTPLGLLAAAKRGIIDELVMRANDIVFAFPAVLLAIMLAAVLGPGARNAVIAIGLFNVPVFARVTRGAALAQWSRDYVLAARLAGKDSARISLEHILPNVANVLIVQATIQISIGIIAEAGLSYIGLGVQPPAPSWGRMLNEAQTLIGIDPWLAVIPGLAIVFAVLGLSLLGEALRLRLDPRATA